MLLLSISRNSPQAPSLDVILLEHFLLSDSVILVEDPLTQKRGFETLSIDH